MQDFEILAVAKVYTNNTVIGMGALKGAPCTVQGVVDNGDGTQTLTLKWTDTTGTDHTTDITLPSDIIEVTSPTNGQTLRYNSTSGKFENSNVSFSADLGDLDDVVLTSVQDGQVLTYDAANNRWINSNGSTVASMEELTDVTITTIQNGQILAYDNSTSKWVNISLADVATSGSASDVSYDNNTSGMVATDAQAAIDELKAETTQIELDISQLSASNIGFDGTTSGLSATDAQGAIDELADEKVDKVSGKGLSQNDFTDALKSKLDNIEADADVNVIEEVQVNGTALTPDANKAVNIEEKLSKLSDVDLTGLGDGYILIYDATNQKWIVGANTGASYTAGEGIEIDQNNVISSKMVLFTGTEAQWNALPLADKIKFTHYATNDDQTGQIDPVPTQNSNNLMTSGGIYTALQDKANTADLATVATSGDYDDLTDLPTLGTAAAKDSTNAVTIGSSDLVESGAVDTAITSAIEALDVSDTAVAGSYVTEVSETDGKVSVVREAADASPTASSNKMVKSGGVYASEQDIYKANGVLGAKNLLPFDLSAIKANNTTGTWNGNIYTINNVDFTFNNDGSVLVDGTASANAEIDYVLDYAISGNFILSDDFEGVASNYWAFAKIDGDSSNLIILTDAEMPVNITSSLDYFRIKVFSGKTASNLTFKPMLRLATDTDATYQPYAKTNVELTGSSLAHDNVLGSKNLLDNRRKVKSQEINGLTFTYYEDGHLTVSGTNTSANTVSYAMIARDNNANVGMLEFPNGRYIMTGCPSNGSNSSYWMRVGVTKNSAYFMYGDDIGEGFEFLASGDDHSNNSIRPTVSINIAGNYAIQGTLTFYPMIRLAGTDSKYVPYAMTNQQLTGDMIYSTAETDTGKVWIDGKKIYRKVFYETLTVPSGGSATFDYQSFLPSTINDIISATGFYKQGTRNWVPFPRYSASSSSTQSLFFFIYYGAESFPDGSLRIVLNSTDSVGDSKAIIVFEYTKTT